MRVKVHLKFDYAQMDRAVERVNQELKEAGIPEAIEIGESVWLLRLRAERRTKLLEKIVNRRAKYMTPQEFDEINDELAKGPTEV